MANRNGVKWSREETILAYELYCRTPFSKISQSNPEIKKTCRTFRKNTWFGRIKDA